MLNHHLQRLGESGCQAFAAPAESSREGIPRTRVAAGARPCRPLFAAIRSLCLPSGERVTPMDVNAIYAHEEQEWGRPGAEYHMGASMMAEEGQGFLSSRWTCQNISEESSQIGS